MQDPLSIHPLHPAGGQIWDGSSPLVAAGITVSEHFICLQRIVVRQERTKKKRSDTVIPAATNGDDPSQIFPPRGVERVAGEGIPHAVETRDNLCRWQTCTDCSPLLRRLRPLPSPRCRSQFPNSPNLPSPKITGWARQGQQRMIRKIRGRGHLGRRDWISKRTM